MRSKQTPDKCNGGVSSITVEGVIGVIQEVTEIKKRELALELQSKERQVLVASEAAAKEASHLKSQFLANVST
jgi:hypothetical protein